MWLSEFKVAIITKNAESIDSLLSQIPQFNTIDEMQEAFYLFKQAYQLLHDLKDETATTMKKIKDSIRYIESTNTDGAPKLDIFQ
ncbi:MAG: hypothetical protein PHX13_03935 [Thiovulaceae bacterium]|nr:hypothetical protein [Sulfurimonadaceae bacterium]